MDKRLYEFLKEKGCEFCYKDKEPFLLNCRVPHEYIEEYSELIRNDIISKINNIEKWVYWSEHGTSGWIKHHGGEWIKHSDLIEQIK